jgi:hypothetical protein
VMPARMQSTHPKFTFSSLRQVGEVFDWEHRPCAVSQVFVNARAQYHCTVFHTSHPFDTRPDSTLPSSGLQPGREHGAVLRGLALPTWHLMGTQLLQSILLALKQICWLQPTSGHEDMPWPTWIHIIPVPRLRGSF